MLWKKTFTLIHFCLWIICLDLSDNKIAVDFSKAIVSSSLDWHLEILPTYSLIVTAASSNSHHRKRLMWMRRLWRRRNSLPSFFSAKKNSSDAPPSLRPFAELESYVLFYFRYDMFSWFYSTTSNCRYWNCCKESFRVSFVRKFRRYRTETFQFDDTNLFGFNDYCDLLKFVVSCFVFLYFWSDLMPVQFLENTCTLLISKSVDDSFANFAPIKI